MSWSKSHRSSTSPAKQRNYRRDAPNHVKDSFISCNLDRNLREELDRRSFGLRTGDRVEVMRGDRKGASGIVNRVDRDEQKVYIDGIEVQKTDGTSVQKPFRPSNLQIVALNLDDPSRIEEYEVEELEELRVSEEEVEEALEEDEEGEMMQQMQTGESSIAPETDEEEEETEGEEETVDETEDDEETEQKSESRDYEEVVSGTISDAKEELEEMDDPDFEAALKAEREDKDRKTFKQWLEARTEE